MSGYFKKRIPNLGYGETSSHSPADDICYNWKVDILPQDTEEPANNTEKLEDFLKNVISVVDRVNNPDIEEDSVGIVKELNIDLACHIHKIDNSVMITHLTLDELKKRSLSDKSCGKISFKILGYKHI